MDNIQFWIWLGVIVVTLIARFRKKQEAGERTPRPTPTRSVSETEESTKPLTFEELLKEIEASRVPHPKPVQSRTPGKTVNYDDDLKEEAKSLEKLDRSFQGYGDTSEIYEKAKQEAFYRPSLEETLHLEDTIVRFDQFSKYKIEERPSIAAEFANEIRNPKGFKKAFIMSEILARRF